MQSCRTKQKEPNEKSDSGRFALASKTQPPIHYRQSRKTPSNATKKETSHMSRWIITQEDDGPGFFSYLGALIITGLVMWGFVAGFAH